MPYQSPEPSDDVDRVFARLHPVDPPAELTMRVMRALPAAHTPALVPSRAAVNSSRRRALRWVAVVAGLCFVALSFHLGGALDDLGAWSVLGSATSNATTFWNAPGEYLAAFADGLPWGEIIVTLAVFVTFWQTASAFFPATPYRSSAR